MMLRTVRGRRIINILLLALLFCAMTGSLCLGLIDFSPREVFSFLTHSGDSTAARILRDIRLPRVLLGAATGAVFALSGAILQGILHNPLASPGILGISSGGGLAGILILLVFPAHGFLLLPAAFLGALTAASGVYLLAWKRGIDPVRLILAGVAVSAMLGAVSGAILLFHSEKAGAVLSFTVGSLAARSWPQLYMVLPYMIAGSAGAFLLAGRLNILMLGDDSAASLGLPVEVTRFLLIATASLLAAAGVGAAGLLGFAGLIAPHIARMLVGPENRSLLPASALTGALLVVLCDTAGRLILSPEEMPAGLLLALLGPPFFLWLLRRRSYEN